MEKLVPKLLELEATKPFGPQNSKIYGIVPPFEFPIKVLELLTKVGANKIGSIIVIESIDEQLSVSVTATEYTPAYKLLIVLIIEPSDHK